MCSNNIKFIGVLPEPVEVGQQIVVWGRLRTNAQRFDLNLSSTRTIHDNIPIHLSWRKPENMIIRNTKNNCGWGPEDRDQNRNLVSSDLGVLSGEEFEIIFDVQQNHFVVSINGRPYCDYDHRLPINEIDAVIVQHDIDCIRGVSQRRIWPSMYPSRIFPNDRRLLFKQDFPNPPKLGNVIIITATPTGDECGRFAIALHQGESKQQALHISSRFPESVVVRNTRGSCGHWGKEELYGYFPFAMNRQFRMAIAFGHETFHITVDGEHFNDFAFRTCCGYDTITALTIRGQHGMNMEIKEVEHVQNQGLTMTRLCQLSSYGYHVVDKIC